MRERSRREKERRRSSTAVSGGGSGVRRRLHLGPVVLDSDWRSLSRSDEYSGNHLIFFLFLAKQKVMMMILLLMATVAFLRQGTVGIGGP
uniref:Uncharacterized protein n=1 Tax=Helianthus annuus TaxID=4232 RepID=A0A251RXN1_HELAN